MTKPKDLMRGFLALVLVAAFQMSFFWLIQYEIPASNEQLITYMLGQLSGFAGAAIIYYFGTTKSSSDKNDIIREAGIPPAAERTDDDCACEGADNSRPRPNPHTNPRTYPDPEFGPGTEKG